MPKVNPRTRLQLLRGERDHMVVWVRWVFLVRLESVIESPLESLNRLAPLAGIFGPFLLESEDLSCSLVILGDMLEVLPVSGDQIDKADLHRVFTEQFPRLITARARPSGDVFTR